MNSKERMSLAMHLGVPDRVPLMCQLALGHYFLNTELPPHKIWFTSEGFAQALVVLQRRYGFDGILINLPGRPPSWPQEIASIREERDGEHLIWRNGDVTVIPWDDNPHHHPADPDRARRIPFEEVDPDHLDDLDDWPMYTWNTYHIPAVQDKPPGPLSVVPDYFYRTIDMVKAEVGDRVSIHGEVFSPFTHYVELLGYEGALMGLITDPAKAKTLLQRFTEASIIWGVAQAQRGVDAVLISSAFAGAGFISPQFYARFVQPYERQVAEAVKACGVPVYVHTCGAIGDRLELMAEAGIMGLDCLDPPPLGTVTLAQAKSLVGDRLFLKGNIDPVNVLLNGDVKAVRRVARETLAAGEPNGGYILSSACSVAPHVSPENIHVLYEVVEQHGY